MDVCIPNLGPRQRHRRLIGGWLALAGAIALGLALAAVDASTWQRALVALPLYGAALGFLQHYEKT